MKIRIFEAFSGYGSQSLALEKIKREYSEFDYEVVGISEIDRYALKAYNALHKNVTNYGDITTIDWDNVPDFDLFTYSFPCGLEGTLVLTGNGYKDIYIGLFIMMLPSNVISNITRKQAMQMASVFETTYNNQLKQKKEPIC